jgi:hypothetical protein
VEIAVREKDAAGKDIVVISAILFSAVTLHGVGDPDGQSTVRLLFNC